MIRGGDACKYSRHGIQWVDEVFLSAFRQDTIA